MEAILLDRHARLGGELVAHRHVARSAGRLDAGLAAGHAGHAMVMGEAMIVAGIGSRKGVAANEVLAAIDAALAAHGLSRGADRPARDGRIEARRAGAQRSRRGDRASSSSSSTTKRCRPRRRGRSPIPTLSLAHDRRAVGLGSGGARRGRAGAAACSARASCSAPSPAPSQFGGDDAMTVHFIGAGPGAADLITVRGRDLLAALPGLPLCRLDRAAGAAAILPGRRAHGRHRAAVARRDRGSNMSPPIAPGRMWRGCIPATCRCGAPSPSRSGGWSGTASPTR